MEKVRKKTKSIFGISDKNDLFYVRCTPSHSDVESLTLTLGKVV